MTLQTIQFRRGTTEEWGTANPVLSAGEPGVEIASGDVVKLKIGNGVNTWSALPYVTEGGDGVGGVNWGDFEGNANVVWGKLSGGLNDMGWLPRLGPDTEIHWSAPQHFENGAYGPGGLPLGSGIGGGSDTVLGKRVYVPAPEAQADGQILGVQSSGANRPGTTQTHFYPIKFSRDCKARLIWRCSMAGTTTTTAAIWANEQDVLPDTSPGVDYPHGLPVALASATNIGQLAWVGLEGPAVEWYAGRTYWAAVWGVGAEPPGLAHVIDLDEKLPYFGGHGENVPQGTLVWRVPHGEDPAFATQPFVRSHIATGDIDAYAFAVQFHIEVD